MSTITIPAELAELVRGGAYLTIESTGDALSGLVGRRDREAIAASFAAQLTRLSEACALLDALGWSAPSGAPRALELNLRRHCAALLSAIAEQSHAHEGYAQDTLGQPCDPAEAWAQVTDMQLLLEHLELAYERELAAEPRLVRTRAAGRRALARLRAVARRTRARCCGVPLGQRRTE